VTLLKVQTNHVLSWLTDDQIRPVGIAYTELTWMTRYLFVKENTLYQLCLTAWSRFMSQDLKLWPDVCVWGILHLSDSSWIFIGLSLHDKFCISDNIDIQKFVCYSNYSWSTVLEDLFAIISCNAFLIEVANTYVSLLFLIKLCNSWPGDWLGDVHESGKVYFSTPIMIYGM
jgi:hypothetical protein